MALILSDRVRETTTTTGTGAVTLLGAVTGYQTFLATVGNANTTYYCISGQGTSLWEVGIGTYTTSTNTLSRTTVLSSSNAGSLVNLSAGTYDVFVTYPSEKAVYLDSSNNVQPSLGAATFTSITDSGLTSGRVTYATTGGLLTDSANLTFSGSALAVTGTLSATGTLSGGTSGTGYSFSGSAPATSLTLDSSGNLGIGIATPGQKLHVERSWNGSTWVKISNGNSTSGAAAGVLFGNDGGDLGAISLLSSGNSPSNSLFLRSLSTNTLTLGTNNTVQATLDSSGNLGLGVTPSAWNVGKAIEVGSVGNAIWGPTSAQCSITQNAYYNGSFKYANTAAASYYQQLSGAHAWYNAPSGTAGNAITFTQAMTLDNSGNLGVGTTSPGSRLQISGGDAYFFNTATYGGIRIGYDNSNYWAIQRENASTGRLGFFNGSSEKVSIDPSGNLLVGGTTAGSTSPGIGLTPNGGGTGNGLIYCTGTASTSAASSYFLYSSGAGAYRFYVNYAGTINATSIVITAISDQRLKENIRDIDTGLSTIMALKPRRFDWKEGKGQDKKNAAGFIAQEFETVFPECVGTSKAGADGIEYKNINHETLIPTLVKAIQELKAEVDALKSKLGV